MPKEARGGAPWWHIAIGLGVAAVSALAIGVWWFRAQRARYDTFMEGAGLLGAIMSAQESYRSEHGAYCDVGEPFPASEPTAGRMGWSEDDLGPGWQALGFRPERPTVPYVVETIAGRPGELGSLPEWQAAGIELGSDRAELVSDHWFVARARGDLDGDGAESLLWMTSGSTNVASRRRSE